MFEPDALYNAVRGCFERDCRKHELHPDAEEYATNKINAMTNNELLHAISDALSEIRCCTPTTC